jgi:release factor glutamine methyltransferase
MTSLAPLRGPADELLAWAIEQLEEANVPTATGDAEIIIAHTLELTRADIHAGAARGVELNDEQTAQVVDFVHRRLRREPLQHLTGKSLFRRLELAVGPGVFVPRRETEWVTELAIDWLRGSGVDAPLVADLGTGAGAIALSIATEIPGSTVYGVEIAPEAFEWTRRNFETIAPGNSHAVLADMADTLHELDGRVDLVVGNPPFQPDGTEAVTPEVQLYDPQVALIGGGSDGLDTVRALSQTALRLLRPGGMLAFEHGISQAPRIAELLTVDGWTGVTTHRDPRGRDRVTSAVR